MDLQDVRLIDMTRITGTSRQTLINWRRNKPALFDVVKLGTLAAIRAERAASENGPSQ